MSFFPTAYPEKLRATMAKNQAYHHYPASPSPSHTAPDPNDCKNPQPNWPAGSTSMSGAYVVSTSSEWPVQGLGMSNVPTLTQPLFDPTYPATIPFQAHSAWPTNTVPVGTTYSYPEYSTQAGIECCCSMPTSSMPMPAAWDHPQLDSTPFAVPCHGSPSRSDYSASSRPSVVGSSPYAPTEGYLQATTPPYIKVEEAPEYERRRLRLFPGMAYTHQPVHASSGDAYTSPPLSTDEQQAMSAYDMHLGTKSESTADFRPFLQAEGRDMSADRRASSMDTTLAAQKDRPRRAYTTSANSTCHCGRCGKLFKRSYNLKAHMETHEAHRSRPNVCQWPGCQARFGRRTDLTRHEQSKHLDERLFPCPLCQRSFARKDTLRRHMDDGCPRRPEVRKRGKSRTASAS